MLKRKEKLVKTCPLTTLLTDRSKGNQFPLPGTGIRLLIVLISFFTLVLEERHAFKTMHFCFLGNISKHTVLRNYYCLIMEIHNSRMPAVWYVQVRDSFLKPKVAAIWKIHFLKNELKRNK